MLPARAALLTAMIAAAALARLLPHVPNVAPVGALALFGGAHFARKRWAVVVPLSAMLLSDLVLYAGRYEEYWAYFPSSAFSVYASMALIACLGFWLRKRRRVHHIAAATVAGSGLFFLVTNFGVWLFTSMYPHTLQGLISCYTAAIPFFRNTLLGDAVYATVLFGGFALAQHHWPVLARQPAATRF